jgi:hypothetical protein
MVKIKGKDFGIKRKPSNAGIHRAAEGRPVE